MGFIIVVEDFENVTVKRILDTKGILNEILAYCAKNNVNTYILKYVDPYDDTIFNNLQVLDLKKDIESIPVKDTHWENLLKELIKLCDVALAEPHLYLKFYGD